MRCSASVAAFRKLSAAGLCAVLDTHRYLGVHVALDACVLHRPSHRGAAVSAQHVSHQCCRRTSSVCSCKRASVPSVSLPTKSAAQAGPTTCTNAAATDKLEQQQLEAEAPLDIDPDHVPEQTILGQVLVCIANTLPAEVCRDTQHSIVKPAPHCMLQTMV